MIYPKPQTYRSKKYLDFIRSHPCYVCGRQDETVVAHHEAFGNKGVGMKAPDTYTIPLCVECHSERHTKPLREVFFIQVLNAMMNYVTEWMARVS